ncbi:hypothetical protein C8J57DRAFT_1333359 [Mycena rebaudengoi]|nr:hypothetical protein C8J57DRAFT_1333359 [Mycena rebaudengoi]
MLHRHCTHTLCCFLLPASFLTSNSGKPRLFSPRTVDLSTSSTSTLPVLSKYGLNPTANSQDGRYYVSHPRYPSASPTTGAFRDVRLKEGRLRRSQAYGAAVVLL